MSEESSQSSVRSLDVRGRHLSLQGVQSDSGSLLDDTFWPNGVFDVRLRDAVSDEPAVDPDLTIVEELQDPPEIRERLESLARLSSRVDFEVTRGVRRNRYDVADSSFYDLADGDSPAYLERRGTRRTLVRTPDQAGARWLTRLVREVATRFAVADGSLILHSSAFTVADGRTFLVVGDSGAGKSTTSIALAKLKASWAWLGNDRMHVDRVTGGLVVTSCPLPLAINKGSLDVMGVTDYSGWRLHNGHPGAESDWDHFLGEDKLKLSNKEVGLYLGVRVVDRGRLAGLILPRVIPGAPFEVARADADFATSVLSRNCFSINDNLYGSDWLGVTAGPPLDFLTVADLLASVLPEQQFRCTLGGARDVLRLADQIETVV